jgi:hypothetical protein
VTLPYSHNCDNTSNNLDLALFELVGDLCKVRLAHAKARVVRLDFVFQRFDFCVMLPLLIRVLFFNVFSDFDALVCNDR